MDIRLNISVCLSQFHFKSDGLIFSNAKILGEIVRNVQVMNKFARFLCNHHTYKSDHCWNLDVTVLHAWNANLASRFFLIIRKLYLEALNIKFNRQLLVIKLTLVILYHWLTAKHWRNDVNYALEKCFCFVFITAHGNLFCSLVICAGVRNLV